MEQLVVQRGEPGRSEGNMTARRIIVTGATGLIGRKLVAALQARGDQVVIFSRDPQRAAAKLPGAADYVAWQPAEDGPWAAELGRADAVVHLAGAPIAEGLLGKRWTAAAKQEIRDSRVIGTRGLVRAMAAASKRPAVFVSGSAIGYYGPSDDHPLDESAAAGHDFLAQVCVVWEAEARPAADLGVRTVLLRTGLLLDPESGVLPQIMLPFKLRSGGPVLPGTQVYSWIHPDDEIGLILFALENPAVSGPLNAAAPHALSNREFCTVLGEVLNSPSWLPVPEFSLRLVLGEMADLVVRGQRAVPAAALQHGYQFRYPLLKAALKDLLG